jgi:predicted ester cyclase
MQMTRVESEALLRRITEEIWNGRRHDLVDELIAEDLVDHVDMPGLNGTGRDRYLASVKMMHAAFSDYHEQIEFVVADDERAVSYVRLTGTHDGDLMGLGPTGRAVDVRAMGILRFAHGQAVERWGIGDNLTQMQQLRLMG